VAYTGTHDNDTTAGWWEQLDSHQRGAVRRYLGPEADQHIHWAMIRAVSQSVAHTAIYPFQDVLGLGSAARMNVPANPRGCWEWRFTWAHVGEAPAVELGAITQAHGRCP